MVVQSSNLMDVEYLPGNHILTILFKNASTYRYRDVPEVKWQGLINAKSPGSYLAAEIKDKFPCAKVQTLCGQCRMPVNKGQEFKFATITVVSGDGSEGQARRACHRACLPPSVDTGQS